MSLKSELCVLSDMDNMRREQGHCGREEECSIGICQLKLSLIVAEINIYNSDSPQNTAETGDLTADIYPHLHNWQL